MAAPLRILSIIGARPQIIKSTALSRAIRGPFAGRIQETILHTGQHYDENMSQVFFDELGIPAPDVHLGIGSGEHGSTTARMIEGIEQVLLRREHDIVVLYGDTNSTLAGALAAAKLHVPVAHIEAGLRSFNKRMPEELNRVICDQCSTWLFCPTDTAVRNLFREGYPSASIKVATLDEPHVFQCGDVMYDNSLHFASLADERSSIVRDLGLEDKVFVLATVHRDNNTDDPDRLNSIFRSLLRLHTKESIPFVVPLHPRTRKMMDILLKPELLRGLQASPSFHLIPPVGFLDMIALEKSARLIMTDSGGVQKEAHFFGKPCVILRMETEWVELVDRGQATLVDVDEERIIADTERYLADGAPTCPPLFGDGYAAEHICEQLLRTR